MSKLLVKSQIPDQDGKILDITPENAGWEYVGFQVYKLEEGDSLEKQTGEQEVCLVLLSGQANVSTTNEEFLNIGERMSVFEEIPPYSVYVPNDDKYTIKARSEEHTSELQSRGHLVCRLLLEKKKKT